MICSSLREGVLICKMKDNDCLFKKILKKEFKGPNANKEIFLVDRANRQFDIINSIKRDQENLLIVIVTFFAGISFSNFLPKSWRGFFALGIFLEFFLILAVFKNNFDINRFYKRYRFVVDEGKKINLDLNLG